jgi:hypothetical protein
MTSFINQVRSVAENKTVSSEISSKTACSEKSISKDFEWLLTQVPEEFQFEAYSPNLQKITSVQDDGNFDKFGGIPAFEGKVAWPWCEECGQDMQFFFQATHPRLNKTFQMFKCLNDLDHYRISCINYRNCIPFDQLISSSMTDKIKKTAYTHFEQKSGEALNVYKLNPSLINCSVDQGGASQRDGSDPAIYHCYKITDYTKHIEIYSGDAEDHCKDEAISSTEIQQIIKTERSKYSNFTFDGTGNSCQDGKEEIGECVIHFGTSEFLPYLWADDGDAHIDEDCELYCETC